ncbi:MAG: helix-turn-helix domain-containing protein [Lysobacterales bacterium]
MLDNAVGLWPEKPVDDGDARHFCSTCVFGRLCLPRGYDKAALHELHCLIEHVGPFHAGAEIFRTGDAFDAVFSVRAGVVKTQLRDERGREQILAFYTPGDLIGLDGIEDDRYPCTAVAVDTVMLCRFSFPAIATLSARVPDLQRTLFAVMARDLRMAQWHKGDFPAEARLADFLLRWGQRLAQRGYSGTQLTLPMPRGDIANYLSLAPETVSRSLRRLMDDGLVEVRGREVKLCQPPALVELARAITDRA